MKTIQVKIDGMHCTSCAMNIDGALEDTPGIANVRTNYAKQNTVVTFDETAIDELTILEVIKGEGYTAHKII